MTSGEPRVPVGPLAWVLAGLAAAVGVAALLAMVRAGGPVGWKPALLPVLWAVPGALIAAGRPRNAVGWLILAVALLFAGAALAEAWTRLDLSGGVWAVWYADRLAAVLVPCTLLALLLLPDGRLPTSRWRIPVILVIVGQGLLVLAWMLVRGPAAAPDATWPAAQMQLPNPVGVLPASFGEAVAALEPALQLPLLLCLPAVAVRLWRADRVERTRLTALLLAIVLFVVAVVAGRAVWPPAADTLDLLAAGFLAVVLVAAVLRQRLADVVVVVHHSVVGAVLLLLVAGGYVLVAGLLAAAGPGLSPFGTGVVAALVALLVHPLRTGVQRLVDRVMFGEGRDPYRALTGLADRTHGALTVAEVVPAVASSIAVSLRLPWVLVEACGTRHEHGTRPEGAGEHATALCAGEAVLGTIRVAVPPSRRLRTEEQTLLSDLGRHAGIAVDAVRLAGELSAHHRSAEELRRSARPLVAGPHGEQLSRREHEVLALVAEGLTNSEIGWRLFISPITARNHVSRILTKLQVRDRREAMLRYRD